MRRSFYAAITRTPTTMENALIRHVQAPEHEHTAAFIRALYKLYQNEVQTFYASQNRQTQFMNQLGASNENTDFCYRSFVAGRRDA